MTKMTYREFFLQRPTEIPLFVRVFNAVPADKLDWRPEPEARTARELLGHLIGHEQDVVELIETDEIHHRMQVAFANRRLAEGLWCHGTTTVPSAGETWQGKRRWRTSVS